MALLARACPTREARCSLLSLASTRMAGTERAVQACGGATELRAGDVVLARVGKHHFWPALASQLVVGAGSAPSVRLVFFGDHKELTVSGAWPSRQKHPPMRPFTDLPTLTARERPNSDLYRLALEEARQWHEAAAANEAAPPERGAQGEEWRIGIDGEVVPMPLLLRAAARRLPRWTEPLPARSTPAVSFRVLPKPQPNAEPIGVAGVPGGGELPVGCIRVGGCTVEDDDDAFSDGDSDDATFERRHSPLEDLEYRGFAAHPAVAGSHAHDEGGSETPLLLSDASCPTSDSCCASPKGKRRHRGSRGRREKACGGAVGGGGEALVGQRVRVPALAFPAVVPSTATPFYDGTVIGVSSWTGRRKLLEVYFAGDHTTCLFQRSQVLQWLLTDDKSAGGKQAAAKAAQPTLHVPPTAAAPCVSSRKRSRDSADESPDEDVEAHAWRRIRLRLAGHRPPRPVRPVRRAACGSSSTLMRECPLLDQICTILPMRASPPGHGA